MAAARLPCRPRHVHPGERTAGLGLDDSRPAAYRSLADGPGSGDAEGLRVSLAAARDKLAQLDERNRRASTVNLGIPAFRDIVGRTATLPRERP